MALVPDYYYDSVFLIPYEDLFAKNIRGLIFDIDNTLTPFDQDLPPEEIVQLLERLKSMGFKVCLLTNNTNGRLARFNKNIQMDGFANALKPRTKGVNQAMAKMETKPESTAIIGDQLLSDVWAGKRANITTIMVKPITERDFFFVYVKRLIERIMLRKFFRNLKENGQ